MAGDKLIYDVEYFTSSQVSLYIGGVFIDEAASIQYGVQESKAPVYGYASRRFDAVIAGNVLVNGGILLNFIDSGYIFAVMQFLLPEDRPMTEKFRQAINALKHADPTSVNNAAKQLIESGYTDNLDKQRVMGLLALASAEDRKGQERGLISVLSRTSDAQRLKSQLEDAIWSNTNSEGSFTPIIPSAIEASPFDIQVDYGFAEKYGNITSRTPSFTRRIIKNCHITGTNQVIDSRSGEPVQEAISFMARDYE